MTQTDLLKYMLFTNSWNTTSIARPVNRYTKLFKCYRDNEGWSSTIQYKALVHNGDLQRVNCYYEVTNWILKVYEDGYAVYKPSHAYLSLTTSLRRSVNRLLVELYDQVKSYEDSNGDTIIVYKRNRLCQEMGAVGYTSSFTNRLKDKYITEVV